MDSTDEEKPLYALLSTYSRAALAHGAWLASFVVATFTFLGLSVGKDTPPWGIGSFIVFCVLGFFIFYNYGRLQYFAALDDCIIECKIIEPWDDLNIRTARARLKERINKKTSEDWRFSFEKSLSVKSLMFSSIFALAFGASFTFLRFLIVTNG